MLESNKRVKPERMKAFQQSLNILPKTNELGFVYGHECFGPVEENRKLDDIRESLMDPKCKGPDTVYSIVMDIGKKEHLPRLKEQHLLYGAVTFSKGQLGKEPLRSQGHIHKKSSYGNNWSTPEVYQIWSGKAVIYMQEFANDDPGRCFAVYANPGDIVVVPPSWAHATISADPKTPLTFGAWCDREYGFEYTKVKAHKGLAWFPLLDSNDGKISWHFNKNYNHSPLIEKKPNQYENLGIKQGECIYQQYEINPDLFIFVPKPFLKEKEWKSFIP